MKKAFSVVAAGITLLAVMFGASNIASAQIVPSTDPILRGIWKRVQQANSADVQAAKLVIPYETPGDITTVSFRINFNHPTSPTRGNFRWTNVNGFTERGNSIETGNAFVTLLPENPSNPTAGSQYYVNTKARTATFIFRWTADQTYGDVVDNDIEYAWADPSRDFASGWIPVDTSFRVNANGYVHSEFGDLRISHESVVVGEEIQEVSLVLRAQYPDRITDARIRINPDLPEAQGYFAWRPSGFYERSGSNWGNENVQLLTNGPDASYREVTTDPVLGPVVIYHFRWAINSDVGATTGNSIRYSWMEMQYRPSGDETETFDTVMPTPITQRFYADPDSDGYGTFGDYIEADQHADPPAGYIRWIDGRDNDNCPSVYNPDQSDTDGDGQGDQCDYQFARYECYDGMRGTIPYTTNVYDQIAGICENHCSAETGKCGTNTSALLPPFNELSVFSLPMPESTAAIPGTNDVTLATLIFDASGSYEDIQVTEVRVEDQTTNGARPIDMNNIRLMVDPDGDSYDGVGTDVQVGNALRGSESTADADEVFTFNLSGGNQFVVRAGRRLRVTVLGNIDSLAVPGVHTFRTIAPNYVSAFGTVTGNSVEETIDPTATGGSVVVAIGGGTVLVSLDPTNPYTRQFPAGTQGVTLATFNFYTTGPEDLALNWVRFTQRTSSGPYADYRDYELLYLIDEQGNTVGSLVPMNDDPVINLDRNAFIVDNNDADGARLTLRANLANIIPASNVMVGGHALGFNIAQPEYVSARGVASGHASEVELAVGDNAPNGNTHYMYRATPTVSRLPLGTTTLFNGTNELFRFTVTANGSDIDLRKFTFESAVDNAVFHSAELYDVTGGGRTPLFSGSNSSGDVWTIDAILNNTVTVSAGTTRTFSLEGFVVGVHAGSSVSTRLMGDAEPVLGETTPMVPFAEAESAVHNDFIWSDRHAPAHSEATSDWTNGYVVTGLPLSYTSPSVLSQ